MKAEQRFDYVEKEIETAPIEIELEFVSPYMKGSTLKQLNDKKLIINLLSIGWVELGLGVFFVALYIYMYIGINSDADKQFEENKKVATTEVFYKYIDNPRIKTHPDSIGRAVIRVEREPKREEAEIIAKYWELGEEGYREYIKEKEWNKDSNGMRYWLFLIGAIITMFVMGFPRRKRFVFDRIAGTVTYPRFWGIRNYTLPFSKINFIYARAGMSVVERKSLAILHPNNVTRVFINFQYPQRFLSLYVWYMDKNRPLPTGTAYNPYRERDYDRRKAEGFPSPLYPSQIDTPEWEGATSEEARKEYRKQVEQLIEKAKTAAAKPSLPKGWWYKWLYSWMYEDTK